MIYPFPFKPEKALESVLYLANKLSQPALHNVSKLLYFADKRHLGQHGRLIYGDQYVAMQYGPVPRAIYNMLKAISGDPSGSLGNTISEEMAKQSLDVNGHDIKALREANLMKFSDSDQECLDWAIENYGHLSFDELTELSHDETWKRAKKNAPIPVELMTLGAKNQEALLAYLRDPFPGTAAQW